jgi:cytochrome c oxidase subunit 1
MFVPPSAADLNAFITIMVLIVGFAQVVFIYNLLTSIFSGKKSEVNPWKATTLEWQTAEFPPGHGNFGDELPVVYRWAYEYGAPGNVDDYVPQNIHPDKVARLPVGE